MKHFQEIVQHKGWEPWGFFGGIGVLEKLAISLSFEFCKICIIFCKSPTKNQKKYICLYMYFLWSNFIYILIQLHCIAWYGWLTGILYRFCKKCVKWNYTFFLDFWWFLDKIHTIFFYWVWCTFLVLISGEGLLFIVICITKMPHIMTF